MKILVLSLLCLLSGCTALQLPEERAWQTLHLVDALQTHDAASDGCHRESHPVTQTLIGEQPSPGRVIAWAGASAVFHAMVTELLLGNEHPRLARWWNYLTIADSAYAIGHNYSIGIRIGAPNRGC